MLNALMLAGLMAVLTVMARAQITENAPWKTLRGHTKRVNAVVFGAEGHLLVTGSDDANLVIWDLQTGQQLHVLSGHKQAISSISLSPGGTYLASASINGSVIVWDLRSRLQATIMRGTGRIRSVSYSPNGRYLALGSTDKTALLLEASSGTRVGVFRGHTHWVMATAFSPDGKTLATGSPDKALKLWNITDRQEIASLEHPKGVLAVAYSPNGQFLATGSSDNTTIIWNAAVRKKVHSLTGHKGPVIAVAFSPDSHYLLTGSLDSSAMVWDVETGVALQILRGHSGQIKAVAYAPDGTFVATASSDKTIGVWRTFGPLMTLLAKKQLIVDRNHAKREAEKKRLVAARGEFETAQAYKLRVQRSDILVAQIDSLAEIKLAIDLGPLHNQISGVLFQTLEPVIGQSVELGQYNPDEETFPVRSSGTAFRLSIPISAAPEFKQRASSLHLEGERQMNLEGVWAYFNLVVIDSETGTNYRIGKREVPIMPLGELIARRSQIEADMEEEITQRSKHLFYPRGEFEPESAYQQRMALANQQRARIVSVMRQQGGQTIALLESRIKESLQQSRKSFRLSPVELGRYSMDQQSFPVTVFGENYEVRIELGRAMAVKEHSADLVVEGMSQITLNGEREYFDLHIFDPQTNSRFPFGVQMSTVATESIGAQDVESMAALKIIKILLPADLTVRQVVGKTEPGN
ncbi:MAG: WD40 repeat domain-containing protein [Candidatus Marinimicrobia bacterium]|nr:WD40 repeat domain-containing protein [Candidatus Neomarinimicrobiota bacterium]